MAVSGFNRKRPSPHEANDTADVAPRRSFLKVLGGATLGAVAAVTGVGSRQSEVLASHEPGPTDPLHDGANPIDGVTLLKHGVPNWDTQAVLEVGRGYDSESAYSSDVGDDESRPAIRGIRRAYDDDTEQSSAIVGHNMADGTGVLGSSLGGPGVRGEGFATGVHGTATSSDTTGDDLSAGVRGNGILGVVGTGGAVDEFSNASGIGVVGLGRVDVTPSPDLPDLLVERQYETEDTTIVTNPVIGGIGVRAVGGTGVEGIADRSNGAGVLGANIAGGAGVVGVGAVGLRGIAVDAAGNIVGSGIVGEGTTGIVGISTDLNGAGIEGSNTTGDGIRGIGKTGIHGQSDDEENGAGVRGEGKAGVHGRATKAQGRGVVGEIDLDDDEDGVAVEGLGKKGQGVRGEGRTGVHGKADRAQGRGVIGEANDDDDEGVAVEGRGKSGEGVRGEGKTGVRGRSDDANGRGVRGENPSGDAVQGEGKTGVRGKSGAADGVGVAGENDNGVGIEGRGMVGVRGVANGHGGGSSNSARHSLASTSATLLSVHLPEDPVAIQGIATGQGATGIQAGAEDGATAMKIETTTPDSVALSVIVPEGGTAVHIRGAACFDTVGMGQFAENARSATVADSRITAESFVYAMLTGDPGRGNGTDMTAVQWVERSPGQGFTVHLNAKVKQATPFSYFIVEPCPPDEGMEHQHN